MGQACRPMDLSLRHPSKTDPRLGLPTCSLSRPRDPIPMSQRHRRTTAPALLQERRAVEARPRTGQVSPLRLTPIQC